MIDWTCVIPKKRERMDSEDEKVPIDKGRKKREKGKKERELRTEAKK